MFSYVVPIAEFGFAIFDESLACVAADRLHLRHGPAEVTRGKMEVAFTEKLSSFQSSEGKTVRENVIKMNFYEPELGQFCRAGSAARAVFSRSGCDKTHLFC